jgi:hypothetical protein
MTGAVASIGTFTAIFMAALLVVAHFPVRAQLAVGVSLTAAVVPLFVPYFSVTLFDFVRTVIGNFSAAFFIECGFAIAILFTARPLVRARDELAFAAAVVALGAAVFLSVVGIFPFDAYGPGFRSSSVGIVLGAILVYGVVAGSLMTVGWAALGAAFWLVGAIASLNIIDHIVDVPSWIAAIVLLVLHGWAELTGRPIPIFGLRMSSRAGRRATRAAAP